jgi:hypothetical protein
VAIPLLILAWLVIVPPQQATDEETTTKREATKTEVQKSSFEIRPAKLRGKEAGQFQMV